MATTETTPFLPTRVLTHSGCVWSDTSPHNTDDKDVITIRLSASEESLLDLLRSVVNEFNKKTTSSGVDESLELRLAGGWVRDKLLGLESDDLDIATSPVTGVETAKLLQDYYERNSKSSDDRKVKVAIISANIAQSKHLETATVHVPTSDGKKAELDFCSLRTAEVYSEDSRIPTVSMGTPKQDAFRRDFTMNTLFFNLQTGWVEDWTGRGVSDLNQRWLCTPLDPHTTFRDDPLRVMRGLRMAVRYHCQLEPALEQAAMDSEIQDRLIRKVSRERVGKELEGMLSGKLCRPIPALQLLFRLQLAPSVFYVPTSNEMDEDDAEGAICCGIGIPAVASTDAASAANAVLEGSEAQSMLTDSAWPMSRWLVNQALPSIAEAHEKTIASLASQLPQGITEVSSRLLPICVALAPLRNCVWDPDVEEANPPASLKKAPPRRRRANCMLPEYIVRESLKFPKHTVVAVGRILRNVDNILPFITQQEEQPFCRVDVGLVIRNLQEHWVTCVLVAACVAAFEETFPGEDISLISNRALTADKEPKLGCSISAMNRLFRYVAVGSNTDSDLQSDHGLDGCWKLSPLWNGKALQQRLALPRGPVVGQCMQEQWRWMLGHPDGTPEECLEYLRSTAATFSPPPTTSTGHGKRPNPTTPTTSDQRRSSHDTVECKKPK